MPQPNIGSAGAAIGGNQAIQEAIARRQGGERVPQLNQMSQAAPGGQQVQPAPDVPAGQAQVTQAPESQAPEQFSNSEAELIIKALSQRLGSISKLQKTMVEPQQPAQQPIQPQGGGGAVSNKISKLVREGKPQDQSIAVAMDMKRRGDIG